MTLPTFRRKSLWRNSAEKRLACGDAAISWRSAAVTMQLLVVRLPRETGEECSGPTAVDHKTDRSRQ